VGDRIVYEEKRFGGREKRKRSEKVHSRMQMNRPHLRRCERGLKIFRIGRLALRKLSGRKGKKNEIVGKERC